MDEMPAQHACTLDVDDARRRLPRIRQLAARLRARERNDGCLVLRFADDDGDTLDQAEQFVDEEGRCCSFLAFELARDDGGVVLTISAPPEAAELLDGVETALDPEADDKARLTAFRQHAADPGPSAQS